MPSPQRARARCRRPLHDDKARDLQVLREAFGDDPRHDLARVMLPAPAVEAQREREGVGEVFGRRGREAIGRVGHGGDRSAERGTRQERDAAIRARPDRAAEAKATRSG